MLSIRFLFVRINPIKNLERFSASESIQDTDEPSSDRLIQGGGRRCDAPLFISALLRAPCAGLFSAASLPSGSLPGKRYWQRKHRMDMAVECPRRFYYFVGVGLENP